MGSLGGMTTKYIFKVSSCRGLNWPAFFYQVAAWGVWNTMPPAPPTEWGSSPSGRLQCSRLDPPQLCCHRVGGLATARFLFWMTHDVRKDQMFVVFFVVCLVTRILSDMVLVRRMVDDVLNQMIIMEGVKHEMTHGVRINHILVDSLSSAWSPGSRTT